MSSWGDGKPTPAGQKALDAMRRALADARTGRILRTELVNEGVRTYERVVNGWRIEELEAEVNRLKDEISRMIAFAR